jgi:hypothetical protein
MADTETPPPIPSASDTETATVKSEGKTTGAGPKPRAKKRAVKKPAAKKSGAGTAASPKYPRHAVDKALRIPRNIYEQNGGRPATPLEAVHFSGGSKLTGPWRVEISSAKKYGYLESGSDGLLTLTERARQAIAPQSPTDRLQALREALLAAPELSEVYNFYRGENLPDEQFFLNALTDRFRVPADKLGEFRSILDESLRAAELIDESGLRPRLLDVGRDETHQKSGGPKSAKPPATDSTCFVVQPFAGALGGYYESIYRPAIEQAGLLPLRADADIFGTGKIMDQIWRGIRGASVLVAELTTKNPNVFYELGLAHALEKPVVLVSSNQDDVPFDLRHIRVILYDKSDPFWGRKLIDKLADNLRSAIAEPEEAIFRVDEA